MAKRDRKKQQKHRLELRKNAQTRSRQSDLTQRFRQDGSVDDVSPHGERVSGKGRLSRKRTVVGEQVGDETTGFSVLPEIDKSECLPGRVLNVRGLTSTVRTDDGRTYECATRRLLKTLSIDQRHVVAAGDRVWFLPDGAEGRIERVEPRRGILSRTSRGRQHIIVTNVDQVLVVMSAVEPDLKPHLIDRFLITAARSGITPLIVITKVDLLDHAPLQPTLSVFSQMGYDLLQVSATTGFNVERVRRRLRDRESVVAGQSGVGKSSLLNAIEPGLRLRTNEVSLETQKGKHTTTTAELLPLSDGGYVVDTPGIRQFQLWDVIPEEVAGYFRDLRPYVNLCRFPDCTHMHETDCAVKDAVADGRLDARRYESYCHLFEGDLV